MFAANLAGHRVKLGGGVFVGKFETPLLVEFREGRALFNRELIERQMIDRMSEREL